MTLIAKLAFRTVAVVFGEGTHLFGIKVSLSSSVLRIMKVWTLLLIMGLVISALKILE